METIVIVNFFVFLIVGGIRMVMGLDLKKWSSWLWGLYAFISGLSAGLLRPSFPPLTFFEVGVIFAAMMLFGGAVMRRNNQLYTYEDLKALRAMMGYMRKHRIAKDDEAEKLRKKK